MLIGAATWQDGFFFQHPYREHALKSQGAFGDSGKIRREKGAKKNEKGAEEIQKGARREKMQGSREQRVKM